jgi:predicted  nucleic acid-binding Zn-ribbon protein
MHRQLEILLELQDLRSQRQELESVRDNPEAGDPWAVAEREIFGVEVERALEELDAKIAELEAALEPGVRERYRRIAGTRGRALVPVIGGVCYGCFMAVAAATATARDARRNERLCWCENCGRFLYFLG